MFHEHFTDDVDDTTMRYANEAIRLFPSSHAYSVLMKLLKLMLRHKGGSCDMTDVVTQHPA